jgi:CO dehydrogenase maturation factor
MKAQAASAAIAKDYDAMVVDCEAGLEQVKRRVLNSINVLLVISDMTARGLKTAKQVAEMITRGDDDVVLPNKAGLIVNRYKENKAFLSQLKEKTGLDLVSTVPEDEHISEIDINGGTIADLPTDAASYVAVTAMLRRFQVQSE